MGLLGLFSGSSPEKHEKKADAFVIKGSYGQAKLEYEKALTRLERQPHAALGYQNRIADKLRRCKESLAREHGQNGKALVEAGCGDDARELFHLALELTADTRLAADIQRQLESIPTETGEPEDYAYYDAESADDDHPEIPESGSDEEYFEALCNSLDDTERDAYLGYPDTFRQGFIALNSGDFDTAVTQLTAAGRAYPFGANYITLELATAHLNCGDTEKARDLLEGFLREYPDSLRAYYLMCEILWETEAFDEAQQLLAGCPATLAELTAVKMLAGETFMRSRQFAQAADLYQDLLATRGWDPLVGQALAETCEARGRNEQARDLYGEIIGACTGCGTRVDPVVKQRYAETSFATGDFSTKILELYLDLVREDPANRLDYYHRISRIYALQGNEYEAQRFATFAQRLAAEE